MAHMQLFSTYGEWYVVETRNGTEVIPADVVGALGLDTNEEKHIDGCEPEEWAKITAALADYCEGGSKRIESVELVEKWGARYSAPGYMDCTDWVLADTKEEAERECKEMYGDDEEEEEDEGEGEPEEGDYTTEDHIHFYQYGKCVVVVPDGEEWAAVVKAHMDREQFWPNVYFVSDHGNSHLLSLEG